MNNRVGYKTISARLSLKNLAETVKIVNKIKDVQSEVTPTYNKSYILFSTNVLYCGNNERQCNNDSKYSKYTAQYCSISKYIKYHREEWTYYV